VKLLDLMNALPITAG